MDEQTRAFVKSIYDAQPDPVLLQVLLLDDIKGLMARLLVLAGEQREEGYVFSVPAFALTARTGIDMTEGRANGIKLFSLMIVNDGAGAFMVNINSNDRVPTQVNAGETFRVAYGRAIISSIDLIPVGAATPTIRISGTY